MTLQEDLLPELPLDGSCYSTIKMKEDFGHTVTIKKLKIIIKKKMQILS